MAESRTVLFLPGAGGAAAFWRPVADWLPISWSRTLLTLPGAGNEPHDPHVNSFEDLADFASSRIEDQADVVAHSMGGVIAMGIALRYPEKIRRLVLVATSGGIDTRTLCAEDWRPAYRAAFPDAASWITDSTVDYTNRLSEISAPTLLVWGDEDPISPVAVGRRLAESLPNAVMTIVAGGTHALALEQPDAVASAVTAHLE